jgi:glycerol-3-phosphate acyltransferase PlsY
LLVIDYLYIQESKKFLRLLFKGGKSVAFSNSVSTVYETWNALRILLEIFMSLFLSLSIINRFILNKKRVENVFNSFFDVCIKKLSSI